ncbi:MAG TPA: outer membrane beta-barrel protein [Longimicrobiales bacterium]|nr:outer membrane beta-barrel protein [Longimicrobiales bacterium]
MKHWKSAIAIVAAFTAFNAAEANAQVGFSVGGGLTIPTGDLGDVVKTGFNAQVGLDIAPVTLPVGFRFEGAFNQFGVDEFDNNWRILSGVANAVLNIPSAGVTPYIIGGLGIYNQSITDSDFDSETDFGINVGGGINVPLQGIRGIFVEARYHNIFTEGSSTSFIPITLGLRL